MDWAATLFVEGCSVCGTVKPGQQGAMLVMTLIISLLPLLLIGGIVASLIYHVRRSDAPPEPMQRELPP